MSEQQKTGFDAAEAADFNVRTLQEVAKSFVDLDGLEKVVILAFREDFRECPYAFRCDIPAVGHPLRADGLELVFARAASIAVAIVGTSHLHFFCQDDTTFSFLKRKFGDNPNLTKNMEQFGCVLIERAQSLEISDFCHLPFRSRSSARQEPHSEPLKEQLFVGIDYGRSDIKTAVVDAQDKLLAKYVTRWWRTSEKETVEYVDPQVLTSHKCHIRCLAEAAMGALQQVENLSKKTVCGVGISAAGCVKDGKLCGIPPAMGGVEDTEETRKECGTDEGVGSRGILGQRRISKKNSRPRIENTSQHGFVDCEDGPCALHVVDKSRTWVTLNAVSLRRWERPSMKLDQISPLTVHLDWTSGNFERWRAF